MTMLLNPVLSVLTPIYVKLQWWPKAHTDTLAIKATELMICLQQGSPTKAGFPNDWRAVVPS